ncbi:benzoylformate decarboxylase [Herbidospora sp. NBRC 101105]|uniref:benzoylformate decarboxylase n=1 Tax=Herbidospora sp. NBRC 101105 TaxID=3032195 RepID=UPI0025533486|nr:benzoylformate decarboxylase [Herbidospora sp. NBRC 101105]
MTKVSEAFYRVLRHHGVKAVFGNPGSNELSFLTGLPDDLPYYLALQEGAAVAMADGFAQAGDTTGFVNLHAASGTGNAMGCLTNAAAGHTPMVVMAGQQARRYVPVDAMLTNADPTKLTDPLVKWSGEPLRPQDGPALLSTALLLARSAPRGVAYLSIPLDDWDEPADEPALTGLLDRAVDGPPVAASLRELTDALNRARDPVLVLGPGADTDEGFEAAVALAEKACLPVWIAPSAPRAPFPTRHPSYRGVLPSAAGAVADLLAAHDLVICVGAPVFRYHAPSRAAFPPADTLLYAVTDDPREAARAPMGRFLLGDPTDALVRLLDTCERSDRPQPKSRLLPDAEPFTAEAILDAVDHGKPGNAVIAFEWTSADLLRDRLTITHPKSLFYPAAGGLGWGLPAAIGLSLARPDRPVLALIGDGALHYTPSALWTAARHQVPVTFVICANRRYRALEEFADLLEVARGDYLDIGGADPLAVARGYGLETHHAETLKDLTEFVHEGVHAEHPRLVLVDQR